MPKKIPQALGPEKAGEVLADLIASDASGRAIAEHHGLDNSTIKAFLEAVRTTYLSQYEEAREHTADELLPMIDTRIMQMLRFMGPEKMQAAGIKDLAIAFGILNEKRQLLKGEPTQIIAMEDRKKLDDLFPLVEREAKRRQMAVDADFTIEGEANGRVLHTESEDTNARAKDYARVKQHTHHKVSRARNVGQ